MNLENDRPRYKVFGGSRAGWRVARFVNASWILLPTIHSSFEAAQAAADKLRSEFR